MWFWSVFVWNQTQTRCFVTVWQERIKYLNLCVSGEACFFFLTKAWLGTGRNESVRYKQRCTIGVLQLFSDICLADLCMCLQSLHPSNVPGTLTWAVGVLKLPIIWRGLLDSSAWTVWASTIPSPEGVYRITVFRLSFSSFLSDRNKETRHFVKSYFCDGAEK